jgi:hypothetical protein
VHEQGKPDRAADQVADHAPLVAATAATMTTELIVNLSVDPA